MSEDAHSDYIEELLGTIEALETQNGNLLDEMAELKKKAAPMLDPDTQQAILFSLAYARSNMNMADAASYFLEPEPDPGLLMAVQERLDEVWNQIASLSS